nr:MAG TPA: hypothetical protein [Caudoviricetes sp.]
MPCPRRYRKLTLSRNPGRPQAVSPPIGRNPHPPCGAGMALKRSHCRLSRPKTLPEGSCCGEGVSTPQRGLQT